jgi:hypothetical protein
MSGRLAGTWRKYKHFTGVEAEIQNIHAPSNCNTFCLPVRRERLKLDPKEGVVTRRASRLIPSKDDKKGRLPGGWWLVVASVYTNGTALPTTRPSEGFGVFGSNE